MLSKPNMLGLVKIQALFVSHKCTLLTPGKCTEWVLLAYYFIACGFDPVNIILILPFLLETKPISLFVTGFLHIGGEYL